MRLILVLDLGTSNTKATLFNEFGRIIKEISTLTPTLFDSEIAEIDQIKLWSDIKALSSAVLSSVSSGDNIAAITVSSMACTMIPVDEMGNSLHNALSWLEKRPYENYTRPFLERFLQGYSIPDCGQYPLNMYPAFKIPWFNDNYPELAGQVYKWINLSDFIYSKLLGISDRYYCDYSIASRYMLFNDMTKDWNEHALKEFSIDRSMLPEPLPSGTIIGLVGSEMNALGFDSQTSVILGGHDHICASVGAVINSPGTVLHSTGTSEVLTTLFTGRDVTYPAKCWLNIESSAYSTNNLIVAFCSASGQIFKSLTNSLIPSDLLEKPGMLNYYKTINKRPLFVPPVRAMQTTSSGSLFDVPGVFEPDDIWLSMYEGFALECKRVLARIEAVSDSSVELVRSVGGQTKNDNLMQLRSNIFNRRLERTHDPNLSSRGAFIIAGVSCGFFTDIMATAEYFYERMEKDVFYPDEKASNFYQDYFSNKYLKLFEKGIYSL